MRLAIPLAIAVLAAVLLAGCGGSSSSEGSSSSSGPAQTEPGTSPKGSAPGAPIGASARNCDTGAVDVEALRTVGVSCGRARQVMHGWQRNGSCAAPTGSSRTSCTARSYRCLSARTDRGLVVGCSRPGESIAFVVKRP
jgi:hypothetical protein